MSDLLKIARAVNDDRLRSRVAAAMLLHTLTIANSPSATPKDKALAMYVVSSPSQPDPSMIAIVASDPAVVEAVELNGDVPNTDNVADEDIKRVVAARWSTVAWKYSNAASSA